MEDNTQVFRTDDPRGGAKPDAKSQSTIFNTSVRGWIALLFTVGVTASTLIVVVGPAFQFAIPTTVETQILTLFATLAGASIKDYFNQKSSEGQTPK